MRDELHLSLNVDCNKITRTLARIEELRREMEECCRELNTWYIASASPSEKDAEERG